MSACERCQAKLNLLSRRHCSECHNHFCARCIANSALKRSQQVCQRCCVFTLPVMERAELNALSLGDLRCYPNVAAPLNSSREQLLELILGYQARVLTERAQLAVRQLQRPGVDVLTVDAETLQPPSSAYSSAATARNLASSGSLPTTTSSLGATLGGDPATTRSKSTEVLDTSSIHKIEDLNDESQIYLLTVHQLKRILVQNCIDYRGCVEKYELLDRVHRLWQERADQKELGAKITADGNLDLENEYLCKICMDSPVDCVFLNCGHMLTCVKCGRQLGECPVCRQYIVKVVHAFRV